MITVVLKSINSTNEIISSVANQLYSGNVDPVANQPTGVIEVDGDGFRMDNLNLVVFKEGVDVALFAQGTWLFACPSASYQAMINGASS